MPHRPAAEVNISLRDSSGSVGRVQLNVGGSVELAAARGAVEALLGPLASAIGCAVVGYSITYTTHLSDGPTDGPQRENTRGAFIFQTATEDQYHVAELPGISAAFILPDNLIDVDAPAVAALVDALVAGPWVNPFGYDLVELAAAYAEFIP